MANRSKTTAERGRFKEIIHSALFKNAKIKEFLIGDSGGLSVVNQMTEFKKHVMSHLFVDETVKETDTYIFYDVVFPVLHTNIKTCKVLMYLICHRDIIEECSVDGYYGNRVDVLSQMVEDVMINDEEMAKEFGIGNITLDSIEIYNGLRFYGCLMTFSVPNFR